MILTNSAFYYGIEIKQENSILAINEGAGEILVQLSFGRYTLTSFLSEILSRLNNEGTLTYTGSIDRSGRFYTISASAAFSLLVASGTSASSAYPDIGFTGADRTGLLSYQGNLAVGFSYLPQFRLQSFVDFNDNQKAVDSTVNVSASGRVELIRFGVVKLMECNIEYATDIDQGLGGYLRTNANGVQDLRAFMQYAVTKGPIEFIPNILLPSAFTSCVLESTPESRDGVDFKLKEKFNQGLIGYYSTGLLIFREVVP